MVMLVLTRKKNELIVIDDKIVIKVLQVKGNRIRLGIEAPPLMAIRRGELEVQPQPPKPDASVARTVRCAASA
jgi:carbon storage regulator